MGSLVSTLFAVAIALGAMIALFVGANLLSRRLPAKWDEHVRPWIFVGPAVLFLFIALFVPAVRTIYLSFRKGNEGEKGFTLENYIGQKNGVLRANNANSALDFHGWNHIFTSRLFFAGLLFAAIAVYLARRSARKERTTSTRGGYDFSSPGAASGIIVAVIVILFAVFTSLRGVIWNNLWWVVAVTGLATIFGLGLAVLADRSRHETVAKTLIFMPMAISLVGASVIWNYMYNIPSAGQSPGLLNLVIGWFGMNPIDFVRGSNIIPWNNFFIMIIMIWIQTGFALVVLSAAIKAVPAELIEAAKVDGASDVQIFWRITVPQIIPTMIVVITTLIVTIMKVFDLVKATTNGNFSTDVLANRMYENLRNGAFTVSSTFAVLIFVLVLPVMWFNFRRTKQEIR